jgi:hypothetical protein
LFDDPAEGPDHAVLWSEVAYWLERQELADPVSVFLVEQFRAFLWTKVLSKLDIWKLQAAESPNKWAMDPLFDGQGSVLLLHLGEESGLFIRVERPGRLILGSYRDKNPNRVVSGAYYYEVQLKFPDYQTALTRAIEAGGPKLLQELPAVGVGVSVDAAQGKA